MDNSGSDNDKRGPGERHQGVFKGEEGKIDKRHGDPEAGGKTSGQKAADTRAERYGDQIHYDKK